MIVVISSSSSSCCCCCCCCHCSVVVFCWQASYDAELLALHELVQQKVSTLLTDPDNVVKRTLLNHGIRHLCVFFGRQKGSHAFVVVVVVVVVVVFVADRKVLMSL